MNPKDKDEHLNLEEENSDQTAASDNPKEEELVESEVPNKSEHNLDDLASEEDGDFKSQESFPPRESSNMDYQQKPPIPRINSVGSQFGSTGVYSSQRSQGGSNKLHL